MAMNAISVDHKNRGGIGKLRAKNATHARESKRPCSPREKISRTLLVTPRLDGLASGDAPGVL